MKATIDDLKRYAYCPKFFEQQGSFLSTDMQSTEDFTKLVTYLFRRDMETSIKQSWKATERRWNKIFFSRINRVPTNAELQAYNRSIVAINKFHRWYLAQPLTATAVNYTLAAPVYDHQIIGDIPVLIEGARGLTMITTQPHASLYEVRFDPAVRYLAMALDEELKIEGIQNISLIDYQIFHVEEFIPSDRYYQLAVLDFVSLMTSMQSSLTYPNTSACTTCSIRLTCEAMKGDA